jgi:AraC-like DNA-binding protein
MPKSSPNQRSLRPKPRVGRDVTFPIESLARKLPSGFSIPRHHHDRAQLIFASSGIMRIATPDGIWVVPPMRAVWVPVGIDHEVRVSSAVQMQTLLIDPGVQLSLPTQCCVVEVSPLLRELIRRATELGANMAQDDMATHLVALIVNEIKDFEALPLHVPMPSDPRLVRICHSILENPSDRRTCAHWGQIVGASARTLERRFYAQTGISLGAWRRQVRLLAALDQLAARTPIANIAVDLGYRSVSAFTVMFKRALGRRPSHFFAQARTSVSTPEEAKGRTL